MPMKMKVALFLVAIVSQAEAFAPSGNLQTSCLRTKLNLSADEVASLATQNADQVLQKISSVPLPSEVSDVLQQIQPAASILANSVLDLDPAVKAILAVIPVAVYIAPFFNQRKPPSEPTFPEQKPATYEMNDVRIPFEFGDAAMVRPLLKQTQLEYRPLKVAFDANKDGYNAQIFHQKVDGKGAAVVLCKVRGQWFGGYNPRGWASLGGSRPSVASFLFYKKPFGWEKMRVKGQGGAACATDLFDRGIYLGVESLAIPLDGRRAVASRLGNFYDFGSKGRTTLLPGGGGKEFDLEKLVVLVGVYDKGEDIPNSAGVLDLGLY